MVRVEQTEFWSDVDMKSPEPATAAFTRRNASVYADETASLTDWFLNEDEEDAPEAQTEVQQPNGEPDGVSALAPVALPAADRPRAAPPRPVYAATPAPKFNMARFLTLTGSLDAVVEEGRWLALPRGQFCAQVMLDAARRISADFLKDLRSPPRSVSISRHRRPTGWLKL